MQFPEVLTSHCLRVFVDFEQDSSRLDFERVFFLLLFFIVGRRLLVVFELLLPHFVEVLQKSVLAVRLLDLLSEDVPVDGVVFYLLGVGPTLNAFLQLDYKLLSMRPAVSRITSFNVLLYLVPVLAVHLQGCEEQPVLVFTPPTLVALHRVLQVVVGQVRRVGLQLLGLEGVHLGFMEGTILINLRIWTGELLATHCIRLGGLKFRMELLNFFFIPSYN
mmetsp:Transcript_13035/g.20229  ORF Transcript_13035/g.20229 Transcript_13035/m.20229 type:complete len:219 (+) Transcript_13035:858-1514(+)